MALAALPMANPPVDPALCIRCKGGRNLCGKPCYLMEDVIRRIPAVALGSRDVAGSSPPGLFVGRYGYPNVAVGPLVPPLHLDRDRAWELADPARSWGLPIGEVVARRGSLVRGKREVRVTDAAAGLGVGPSGPGAARPDPILRVTQELAMADRPAETEMRLARLPARDLQPSLGDFFAPMGPSVVAERARLIENAHVPRRVDAVVSDVHAKAEVGLLELSRAGVGVEHLQRLLSAGLLGQASARRLVPTRWSITATDDILGRHLMDGVKDLPVLGEFLLWTASYAGNHFHVAALPRPWSYEMLEVWRAGSFWAPTAQWAVDWEGHAGRTTYADNITGAYYAARLASLEHLVERLRRQATVVVYREITEEYWAPLGVWLIRETVRRAFQSKPLAFGDVAALVAHVRRSAREKDFAERSRFLGGVARQGMLEEFGARMRRPAP